MTRVPIDNCVGLFHYKLSYCSSTAPLPVHTPTIHIHLESNKYKDILLNFSDFLSAISKLNGLFIFELKPVFFIHENNRNV